MSQTVQISLNKKRLVQVGQIIKSRKDCRNLLPDDVVKKLLFEKMDEMIPMGERK